MADAVTAPAEDEAPPAKKPAPAKDLLETPEEEKPKELDDSKALTVFLKQSGYSKRDVDGVNERNLIFVTKNGGKYAMNRKGAIRTLKGPTFPNFVEGE